MKAWSKHFNTHMHCVHPIVFHCLFYEATIKLLFWSTPECWYFISTGSQVSRGLLFALFIQMMWSAHNPFTQVVSVSLDCQMKVWDTDKGQLQKTCEWQPDKKTMWRVRACRCVNYWVFVCSVNIASLCFFSFAKTEEGNVYLFTISVPVSLPKKELHNSYVCRWSVNDWEVDTTLKYKGDILTALAVRLLLVKY